MATAKSSKIVSLSKTATEAKSGRIRSLSFFGFVYKLNLILMTVGLLIWIFVGSFFSLSVVEQLKAVASQKVDQKLTDQSVQVESPKEVPIPGIGTVNIECVKANVKQEVIQKISIGSGDDLTDDEKAQFGSCIVKASATPSASPAN